MDGEEKSICFVIMGAKVRENGQPSGAMLRRVKTAMDLGKKDSVSWYLVTGGIGTSKFSEAHTMKDMLLGSGIPEDKIILEELSTNTISSVMNCSLILRNFPSFNRICICTDRYHIPRCRWLFHLMGFSTYGAFIIGGLKANGIFKWTYYYFREAFAIPWDTIRMSLHRLHLIPGHLILC
jgi:vancomycin permeability regulator SanA